MGLRFADQYSLLHFASGVVAYFVGVPLIAWIILHAIFEIVENSAFGMGLINKVSFWPGGKPQADALINSIGDEFFAVLGWIVAYWVDYLGKKYGWYGLD